MLLASVVYQPAVLVVAVEATTMIVEAKMSVEMAMTIDVVSTVILVVLAVSTAVITAALLVVIAMMAVKMWMVTMVVQVDGRVVLSAMPGLSEAKVVQMAQVQ